MPPSLQFYPILNISASCSFRIYNAYSYSCATWAGSSPSFYRVMKGVTKESNVA